MNKAPHIYGQGTRLSNAYTMGVDGLPAAEWFGGKNTAAYKAWQRGRADAKAGTVNFDIKHRVEMEDLDLLTKEPEIK